MPTQPPPERQYTHRPKQPLKGPGWPDARGWIALGMFLLSWRLIEIIAADPKLLLNASFMQVVTLIIGSGGLLLVLAFHFAASKGASEANERADKANDRLDAATKAADQ